MSRATCAVAVSLAILLGGCDEEDPAPADLDAGLELDLADVYLRHDRLDEAARSYEDVLRRSPETPDAGRAEYGLYLVATKREDTEAGIRHLERARELAPEENVARIRLELAAVLARAGRMDEAEAEIETLLAGKAEQAIRGEAFRVLLESHQGRVAELVAKTERRVAEHPEDLERLGFLGDLQAEVVGDPKGAVASYERYLSGQPENAVVVGRLLDLSIGLGDLARTFRYGRWLEGRLKGDPAARFEVLHRLALAAMRGGKVPEALELLASCREIAGPERAEEVAVELYSARRAEGTLGEEVARLEAAGELEDLWLIHTRVTQDPGRALEVAEKMLAARPESVAALAHVVDAAGRKEDWERLVSAAEKMLELDPRSASVVAIPYAAAMRRLERSDPALERLKQIAAADAAVKPQCSLAIAGLVAGGERETWFQSSLEAAKQVGDPQTLLAVGRALREGGSPARGLAAVEAALVTGVPPALRPDLEWERILCLEALGRLDLAEEACRQMAGRAGIPPVATQAAERKLLDLIQRQGKKVEIRPR